MKKLFVFALMVALVASLASVALAAFPEREVEWVLWSNPGGGSDLTARTAGMPLRKALGQSLVIKNMAGGSGSIAMNYVQKQPADGYTWLFVTNTLITTTVQGLVDYTMEDWEPVFMLNHDPQAIAVNASSDIKNIDDLIAAGKERTIKFGLSHLGGNDHVAINTFATETGIQYKPIVYESGGEVMVAALGGSVDVFISNPSEIMSQVEAGKLQIVAVMAEDRLDILPDVPTMVEKGYDNLVFGTWRGVVVKAGTPEDVIKKMDEMFLAATDSSTYRNFLKNNGMNYNVKKAEEFKKFIRKEWPKWENGMKALEKTQ